ncbi:single-stranded DNA-binding protein [Staphylococcus coagulans]|uniref:Single-stranded DNA-binding protein n=1 Tax=Staphylococcus coagulans TaxID=74706 RepID=A0A9X0PI18_9STAP|nr:single-stranded DNA-binding protein [Staphylococcus coagulans]MBA8772091.1 single-stranded DNA-binding protein [Staphylococcus coagulans]MBA8777679.1 single-stranded DNA-binding protein [Staphylococcus coagulans]
MKITGRAQHITETSQEAFMKGGDFLGAGEFTVKIKDIEANDAEGRYFTIVFENNEGKQFKHNQFVPPFQQDYQEKQYIELLTRLGIKLNLPDLTFDTDQLINKPGTIVLKNKFNEDQGKYFVRLSFVKAWKKGDEIINKPEPKTDEMKQKEKQTNGRQTPMSQESNPFANANGPIDIDDEILPF